MRGRKRESELTCCTPHEIENERAQWRVVKASGNFRSRNRKFLFCGCNFSLVNAVYTYKRLWPNEPRVSYFPSISTTSSRIDLGTFSPWNFDCWWWLLSALWSLNSRELSTSKAEAVIHFLVQIDPPLMWQRLRPTDLLASSDHRPFTPVWTGNSHQR